MSNIPPDLPIAQEPGDVPGAIEAHFLLPRDAWAALEGLAVRHEKTHSLALVDAVALAHYVDLELTAGSQLVARRANGKFYELFFPWLHGSISPPVRGSITVQHPDSGGVGTADDTAEARPIEWSPEEEEIRREIRLDNLSAERELARMRNQQRIEEARQLSKEARESKRRPGFWRRWRRNLFR